MDAIKGLDIPPALRGRLRALESASLRPRERRKAVPAECAQKQQACSLLGQNILAEVTHHAAVGRAGDAVLPVTEYAEEAGNALIVALRAQAPACPEQSACG